MRIQYTGKAAVRVEGIGAFAPGETRDVPDRIGRELARSGEFRRARDVKPRQETAEKTPAADAGEREE